MKLYLTLSAKGCSKHVKELDAILVLNPHAVVFYSWSTCFHSNWTTFSLRWKLKESEWVILINQKAQGEKKAFLPEAWAWDPFQEKNSKWEPLTRYKHGCSGLRLASEVSFSLRSPMPKKVALIIGPLGHVDSPCILLTGESRPYSHYLCPILTTPTWVWWQLWAPSLSVVLDSLPVFVNWAVNTLAETRKFLSKPRCRNSP